MTEGSNTGGNRKPGTFVKGDPRINRLGRPKSFDALRELAQQIAHEKAKTKGETIVIDGHAVTVAEMIVRQWAQSGNAKLQQAFIEIAFGKVPQAVELTGKNGGAIEVETIELTDDERAARVAALLDAARKRRDRQAVDEGLA